MKSFYELSRVIDRQRLSEFVATGGAVSQGTGGQSTPSPATPTKPASMGQAPVGRATGAPLGVSPLEGMGKVIDKFKEEIKRVREYAQASGSQPPAQLAQMDTLVMQMTTLMKQMGHNTDEEKRQKMADKGEADKAHQNATATGPAPQPAVTPGQPANAFSQL